MSDQDWADKAARKVYQFCVDLIHDGADSPLYRDRYEKIASLIRSAAPSSALVDAANKAIDSSHSDNPQDWLDAIDALRAALSAQEPKVCVHVRKPIIGEKDIYEVIHSCGRHTGFCGGCGFQIEVKEG